MPIYDAFLSYIYADKQAVEFLAHKLEAAGIAPFLGQWHLVPGEPWQEGLETALDESRTCVVFLGRQLGPWQNEEMRLALADRVRNQDFRVIPVLLPGGPEPGEEKFPRFLSRLSWVDFREGPADEAAFRRLLAGIRGEAPGSEGSGASRPPVASRSWKSLAWTLPVVLLAAYAGYIFFAKPTESGPTLATSSAAPVDQPLVLRGEILDASTGNPLPGVVVQLPELRLQEISDATGQYRFKIPSRETTRVKMRATLAGYFPLNLDLTPGRSHLNTHRMRRIP